MPTVAEIRVKLLADLAELDRMKSKANAAFREVNRTASREMREAKGSMMLLGDEVGIRLPRHLQTFVAKLPGVATAMSAAFDTIAVIALIDIVVKAGEKITEFVQKNREATEKLKESQEGFELTVEKTFNTYREKLLQAGIKTDELKNDHVDALHKQLQLIDMQGFDQLEGAFKSLESQADKTFDNIKSSWLSVITEFSFAQASGFKGTLTRFGSEYSSLLAQGKGDEAQNLLNTTQQREEQNRADLSAIRSRGIRSWAHSGLVDQQTNAIMERLRSRGITDYSDETYNAATQTTAALEAQQNIAAYQHQLTASDKQEAIARSDKEAASGLIKNLEEQLNKQVIDRAGGVSPVTTSDKLSFWQSHLNDFAAGTEQYKAIVAKIAETTTTLATAAHEALQKIRERIKQRDQEDQRHNASDFGFGYIGTHSILTTSPQGDLQHAKASASLAEERAKTSAELQTATIRYQQATGAISAHEAALEELQAKQSELAAQYTAIGVEIDDLKAQAKDSIFDPDRLQALNDRIAALKYQQAALQDQSAAAQLQYQEQTMSAMDQVFAYMAKGAQDIDTKIAQIMERTLDGLNDQFVNAMFGEKTNFHQVFQQSEKSLAKVSLQWIEGTLMGKGKGSKGKISELQLSATNGALNVHVASSSVTTGSGPADSSSASSAGSSIFSSIPGVSGIADKLKNSSFGQNAGKFLPGVMDMAGGLMDMFSGPQHVKGEGSGVANALSDANYKENSLSRWLTGFGQIAKGAGSMMFAGAGGMQGLNDSDAAGGLFGGRLFGPGGIFDSMQGYASGGDPVGGVPIEVGEVGPEIWTPPTSGGHITPNRDIAHGGSPTYVIDARATDPALTQANVARAIASSNAHAVDQAQSRMVDRQRRTPR